MSIGIISKDCLAKVICFYCIMSILLYVHCNPSILCLQGPRQALGDIRIAKIR
jgi:hypothetical protein